MELKDLPPGDMFRRPTGKFRYIVSPLKQEEEGCRYPSYFCFNLDGQSDGYWIPGSQEVVKLSIPYREEEERYPFWMLYVEGSTSPTVKHDSIKARVEAERLAHLTRKKVFVLRAVSCVAYKPPTSSDLTWTRIEKDS